MNEKKDAMDTNGAFEVSRTTNNMDTVSEVDGGGYAHKIEEGDRACEMRWERREK